MSAERPSHYRCLGVAPSASTQEIHVAYRALAARLHPDRLGGEADADRRLAERRMQEINVAWEVLKDPTRRKAYDLARRSRSDDRPPGPVIHDDTEDGPHPLMGLRHLSWVALAILLAVIFVFTAYASSDRPDETPVRESPPEVGTCIDVQAGPATTIVPCAGPHEFEIVSRTPDPVECPTGTEARRLGRDGLFDCLRSR